ncbi:hypothetical protein BDZ89DRAFT_1045275 [Hymenopellis radicata]|nr:hypothetical protein BDZ89DRAFT_1045275 [Hymenopellis radicata]
MADHHVCRTLYESQDGDGETADLRLDSTFRRQFAGLTSLKNLTACGINAERPRAGHGACWSVGSDIGAARNAQESISHTGDEIDTRGEEGRVREKEKWKRKLEKEESRCPWARLGEALRARASTPMSASEGEMASVPILELLSGENRVLLVWWDTLFVLYLRLDLENEGQSEGWTPTGCWARMSASSPCSSLSTQEVACLRVKSATQPNPPPSVPSPASVALPDSAASSRNIRIATSLEGLCWAQRLGQLELGCPISAGLRVAASQIDGLRVREAIWVTEKKKKRRQTEIWGWMTRPRRCVLWEWEEEER